MQERPCFAQAQVATPGVSCQCGDALAGTSWRIVHALAGPIQGTISTGPPPAQSRLGMATVPTIRPSIVLCSHTVERHLLHGGHEQPVQRGRRAHPAPTLRVGGALGVE